MALMRCDTKNCLGVIAQMPIAFHFGNIAGNHRLPALNMEIFRFKRAVDPVVVPHDFSLWDTFHF